MKVKIAGFKNLSKLWGKYNWEEGIQKVGDIYFRTHTTNDPRLNDVDCFYQFNVYNKYNNTRLDRIEMFNFIKNSKKPFLVREEGCFRQTPDYKTLGWYHYQMGRGKFNNDNVDNSRWEKFKKTNKINLHDWKSRGDNILILGQVENDSALIDMYDNGYISVNDWIFKTIKIIRKYTDRPIILRPHPKDRYSLCKIEHLLTKKYKNISLSTNFNSTNDLNGGKGLENDFNQSYCAVSYNSNSLVEAALYGIPIFVADKYATTASLTQGNISCIENLDYSIDRDSWCNKAVYTVWSAEEFKSGEAWAHLKPVYF